MLLPLCEQILTTYLAVLARCKYVPKRLTDRQKSDIYILVCIATLCRRAIKHTNTPTDTHTHKRT